MLRVIQGVIIAVVPMIIGALVWMFADIEVLKAGTISNKEFVEYAFDRVEKRLDVIEGLLRSRR